MKQFNIESWSRPLRYLLALLFLWAAVSKLANPLEFLASIYAYELPVPDYVLKLVAVSLPWLELLCALMLLADVWTETALVAITGLLMVFVLTTGQAWLRGLSISCGCFNLSVLGLDTHSPVVTVVESVGFAFIRNLALAAVSGLLLRSSLSAAGAGRSNSSAGMQPAGVLVPRPTQKQRRRPIPVK